MRPIVTGRLALPVEQGARFEPGRFLSMLARHLERDGASVRRHANTLTFEQLHFLGSRRAFAWCDGSVEVLEESQGPVFRYSLRFREAMLMLAGLAGLGTGIGLLSSWTQAACLFAAIATFLGVQAVQVFALVVWCRWKARRTARDITYRPPRAAA